jgi:tRNA nucleotidyltransferase (CCA-adding enzyme)
LLKASICEKFILYSLSSKRKAGWGNKLSSIFHTENIQEKKLTNSDTYQKKDVTVITTHINADFDAMASLLAAQKLYPDSVVVFPGSQEQTLRNFFINSMVYLFNMADMNSIDFSQISRLVLVDTRQPGRIGKLASLVDEYDVEIHIYDHHPSMPNDIKGDFEVLSSTGATVTILTEILEKKGIDIGPDEATIMILGIYEDTGSFTFPSTTGQDFNAAALLLSKGANLNTVSDLIAREISPEQVGLLNDMLQGAIHFNIHGIDVVITTVNTDNFVPDFAFLVHKMVRMENLNAIFALAGMGNKIYIVARSRVPEVDVGAILKILGGGGHSFAAAGTIRGKTLVQAQHELVDILYKKVQSRHLAADLMTSPAIIATDDISCKEANDLLTRYNINALVLACNINGKDQLKGYITRQVIEKALYHKLDHVQIKEYMTTDVKYVMPNADIFEIQEKIIGNKQRVLPVVDKGIICGVITRTDLLNHLVRKSQLTANNMPDPIKNDIRARTRNVKKFLQERQSLRIMNILMSIGETASEMGVNAYAIGGFVRDLFLYRSNEDIDIVIEGEAIAFAKKYAEKVKARVHTYRKFGTAVIIFEDGFKVDIAAARMEYYRFPADLPTVEMSSLKLDLFRRDFTINTLAIHLNPEHFGTLIDFFIGLKDLKEKTIRVLHNLSFVEDPTRVFRAIRFEQRFDFTIGKLTEGLIKNAVKMEFFKRLSGRRVFNEIRSILEEETPTPAIIRMNDYNLLKVIHPSLVLDKNLIILLNSAKKVIDWFDLLFLEESYMRWIVYLLLLIRHADKQISHEVCKRLELPPRYSKIFCYDRFEADKCLHWLEQNLPIANSILYKRLWEFRTELILYMMAASEQEKVKKAISHFFTKLRYIHTSIKGDDLIQMGLEPGPMFREIFEAVRDAKLDGQIRDREDEILFAEQFARTQKLNSSITPESIQK